SFKCYHDRPDLHSFPTRRSSDLVQVSDNEISRRHAEIRKDEQGYLLVDLGSSNGTFVNAEQVTERRLVNGDRVQLGRTLLLFTRSEEHTSELQSRSDLVCRLLLE